MGGRPGPGWGDASCLETASVQFIGRSREKSAYKTRLAGGHEAGSPVSLTEPARTGAAGVPLPPREGRGVGRSAERSPPLRSHPVPCGRPWHLLSRRGLRLRERRGGRLRAPQPGPALLPTALASRARWSGGASVRTGRGPPRPARRRGWQGSRGSPRCSLWTGRSWVRFPPAPSWAGAHLGPPRAPGPTRHPGILSQREGAGGQEGSAGQLAMGGHHRGCWGAAHGTAPGRPGLRAPAGSCLGLPWACPRPGWTPPGCRRGHWQGPFRPRLAHLQWKQTALLSARPSPFGPSAPPLGARGQPAPASPSLCGSQNLGLPLPPCLSPLFSSVPPGVLGESPCGTGRGTGQPGPRVTG